MCFLLQAHPAVCRFPSTRYRGFAWSSPCGLSLPSPLRGSHGAHPAVCRFPSTRYRGFAWSSPCGLSLPQHALQRVRMELTLRSVASPARATEGSHGAHPAVCRFPSTRYRGFAWSSPCGLSLPQHALQRVRMELN
ncbi:hypothetical protein CesoFtcFv8_019345 [Champsocephalus esox]|uniref:Uncharacterized protein n=1 Tax=Champsocephalus esox TaxID=159716 RepID=A0AAN8GND5_9TELE|nr:hypothetical protein CesoFtcFv8_019345 [Champsocephalus esox]